MECISDIVNIFYDLSSQDIPDFFQDNMCTFLNLLKKYLHYSNPLIGGGNDDCPGVVENIKTEIFRILDFYFRMYPDEIPDFFELTSDIYTILMNLTNIPKYDELVISAIEFLRDIVQSKKYTNRLRDMDLITSICQSAIIKNIEIRDADVELFEDDPIEYVRRIFQGTDVGTRRKAASDMAGSMLVDHASETTEVLNMWINQYFEEYHKDPLANWKYKDNAIYLFTALSIKTKSSFTGAITINTEVPVMSILSIHILPELSPAAKNHPLIKVGSMLCVYMFINQVCAVGITLYRKSF